MAARTTRKSAKKTTGPARKKSPGRPGRASAKRANPIDDALARLERDLPRLLRQLRGNVQDLQKQVDRARADGEKRWRGAERKIKQDAALLRKRLEKSIDRMRGGAKRAGRKRRA